MLWTYTLARRVGYTEVSRYKVKGSTYEPFVRMWIDDQACVYASEIPHMTRGMRHLDLKVETMAKKLLNVASVINTSD